MHPAKQQILRWFSFEHLPEPLRATLKRFHDLAHEVAESCDGPEATVALRKLLEAKDAAVRATIGNPMGESSTIDGHERSVDQYGNIVSYE